MERQCKKIGDGANIASDVELRSHFELVDQENKDPSYVRESDFATEFWWAQASM
jgi:hypothetical protein